MEDESVGLPGSGAIQRRWLRVLITGILIALSGIILGGIILSNREELLNFDWQFKPGYLVLAFAVFSLDLLLVAMIWGSIMNTLGGTQPGKSHLRVFILSNISKRLPGTIWYILSRAQFYRGSGIPGKVTTLASGIEFVVATVSSVLISLLFAVPIISGNSMNIAVLVAIILIGIGLTHPRFLTWLLGKAGIDARFFSYRRLIAWICGYLLAWVLSGIIWYLVGNTFADLPADTLWYIIGSLGLMNIVSSLLFLLPSNFGVMEIGMTLLLSSVMPQPLAVVLTLATRILIIASEIVWALLVVWL
ncbi:MAG TPA: hypothetical protein VJ768_03690 [Anaerolineales bacterium]|nr:hypothetical protein [Anaerolineales bacterium]